MKLIVAKGADFKYFFSSHFFQSIDCELSTDITQYEDHQTLQNN